MQGVVVMTTFLVEIFSTLVLRESLARLGLCVAHGRLECDEANSYRIGIFIGHAVVSVPFLCAVMLRIPIR